MLAEDAMTEISLTGGVTARGRVWAYIARRAGQAFEIGELTAAVRGVQHSEISSCLKELVSSGLLARSRRGVYKVLAKDVAVPPPVAPLPFCFSHPQGKRGLPAHLHVPATIDGAWRLMLYLDRHGKPITWRALSSLTLADDGKDLRAFVTGLVAAGYLARGPGQEETYRLLRRQAETPRLTQSGKPLAHAARAAHMWRAMKMCGYFTARDLAIAASVPEWPVGEDQARGYAEDLVAVGYLMCRGDGASRIYRLKAKMNTGPSAPRVLRARFVWDPNLCRVIGPTVRIDEVRT